MSDAGPLRLSIWSGPRNVSTALMYAFRSRPDAIVFDEPLYGHYLATHPDVIHPGGEDVLAAMDDDGARVVREVLLGDAPPAGPGTMGFKERGRPGEVPPGTRIRMFKNMAHHLRELELGSLESAFLDRVEHALLTRDPREMLPSLAEKIAEPRLSDTGLPEQVELLERLVELGRPPVVLDATRLLQDPAGVLRRACERWGVPWDEAMLTWKDGPKPEDGVWARHWYGNVHASTGFAPYAPPSRPFPDRLRPLLDETAPMYERLLRHAL